MQIANPNPTPSPNGTKITSASAPPIIDANGNAWTLVQSASNGLQIAIDGTVDAVTQNVRRTRRRRQPELYLQG